MAATAAAMALAHTDWLHHTLEVFGHSDTLAALQTAATGAGIVPWRLDLDRLQEDWFHRLIAPAQKTLSVEGARILAGQLREAVERRQALAATRVGRSTACPFDLHALVPVPTDFLHHGPDDPDAHAWLWEHWGTTQPLRHVSVDPADRGSLPKGPGEVWRLSFWSADWTPWRALERIRSDWPGLLFDIRPTYDPR